MKVEIWSDIMCPWCYIGKRRFEQALNAFEHRDKVEIIWKSFQLNPEMKTDPDKNIIEYLSETKGWTVDYSQQMHDHVTGLAKQEGLTYNFDHAVVANSFDAHRLIQLAKKNGLGDAAEERLFKAYFTEGQNIADHAVLVRLGTEIGLDGTMVSEMLKSKTNAAEVKNDIAEAQQLGVRGVPFFVLDRKYGVSGAQQAEVFASALKQAWEEWKKQNDNTALETNAGAVCTPGEPC
jgi:predicted DsbA family dithiol-disulfide isomerase